MLMPRMRELVSVQLGKMAGKVPPCLDRSFAEPSQILIRDPIGRGQAQAYITHPVRPIGEQGRNPQDLVCRCGRIQAAENPGVGFDQLIFLRSGECEESEAPDPSHKIRVRPQPELAETVPGASRSVQSG